MVTIARHANGKLVRKANGKLSLGGPCPGNDPADPSATCCTIAPATMNEDFTTTYGKCCTYSTDCEVTIQIASSAPDPAVAYFDGKYATLPCTGCYMGYILTFYKDIVDPIDGWTTHWDFALMPSGIRIQLQHGDPGQRFTMINPGSVVSPWPPSDCCHDLTNFSSVMYYRAAPDAYTPPFTINAPFEIFWQIKHNHCDFVDDPSYQTFSNFDGIDHLATHIENIDFCTQSGGVSP